MATSFQKAHSCSRSLISSWSWTSSRALPVKPGRWGFDTGDTIVYATEGWEERKAAELAAVQRIFGLLPSAQGEQFLALWQEFEAAETAESRFANAADRAMPVLLNLANNGQSWRENGISYQRVVGRIREPIEAGCPALWAYLAERLAYAETQGWFGA